MDDPIPAAFITLPEALQRIANCMSEAHVESAKLDFQANAIVQTRRGDEQSATSASGSPKSEGADSETYARPSQGALLHWDKRNFAVAKLISALQTGTISAMVRSPESGEQFRLTPADWHFEPFREKIIRGGVIPPNAGSGFECHRGRTVLLETLQFETWIAVDVKLDRGVDRRTVPEMARSGNGRQSKKEEEQRRMV